MHVARHNMSGLHKSLVLRAGKSAVIMMVLPRMCQLTPKGDIYEANMIFVHCVFCAIFNSDAATRILSQGSAGQLNHVQIISTQNNCSDIMRS